MTGKLGIATWVIYGVVAVLLIVIVSGALSTMFPSVASTRIAYNSEGYLFALVLGLWLQVALPRVPERRRFALSAAHGGLWAIIGIALLLSDLPSRIRTLNEAALGLAIVIPYVALRRPLPRWVPWSSSLLLVALTVWAIVGAPSSWVIDQAETFGFIVLAVLTFDVFDRPLIDDTATSSAGVRWAWYGFMILEPIVVSAIGTDARSGSGAGAVTLLYLGRIHESFVGVLLVVALMYLSRVSQARARTADGQTRRAPLLGGGRTA